MKYTFARGQTQILYRYMPGAVFDHDDYGLCKVGFVSQQEADINQEALFSALQSMLMRWERSLRDAFPDPSTLDGRRQYAIGEPREVMFEPFPLILECGRCGRVFRYQDLRKTGNGSPGRCPECRGRLTQLPYVLAHNCGRIEQLYFPSKGCNEHGREYIKFYDPGRAQQARWLCGICGQEIQRLRMTPCNCEFAKRGSERGARFLRIFNTADPAVHFSHIITFVNFDERQEEGLRSDKNAFALLLARAWGMLSEPVREVLGRRQGASRSGDDDRGTLVGALVEQLKRVDPENELLQKLRTQEAQGDGSQAVKTVDDLLGDFSCVLSVKPPRQLVEHVTILDELSTSTAVEIAREQAALGRTDTERLNEADAYAREQLGFSRLTLIDDFPIAVAAVGYSRVTRKPDAATIIPFPSAGPTGIPLYAVPADTEGILVQLAPERVLKWLELNDYIQAPLPPAGPEAWAASLLAAPQLLLQQGQQWYAMEGVSAVVYGLLHTISHILLRGVEWSGFSPASVGEYILPGTLSSVLYLSRYEETKLGGLATLFEENLLPWLVQAHQEGRECMYDPVCADEGGACIGCLYREYNCPDFNNLLSRSLLYGGQLDFAEAAQGTGFIQHGYWDMPD